MPIGTAEGCDTEKHYLRSTISMTLVAKHFFLRYQATSLLHLHVILLK